MNVPRVVRGTDFRNGALIIYRYKTPLLLVPNVTVIDIRSLTGKQKKEEAAHSRESSEPPSVRH